MICFSRADMPTLWSELSWDGSFWSSLASPGMETSPYEHLGRGWSESWYSWPAAPEVKPPPWVGAGWRESWPFGCSCLQISLCNTNLGGYEKYWLPGRPWEIPQDFSGYWKESEHCLLGHIHSEWSFCSTELCVCVWGWRFKARISCGINALNVLLEI